MSCLRMGPGSRAARSRSDDAKPRSRSVAHDARRVGVKQTAPSTQTVQPVRQHTRRSRVHEDDVGVLYPPPSQPYAVMWEPITNLGCSNGLAGCNLKGAELAGAYLKNANLSRANLKAADFTSANLSGANLTECNLKGANLTNANLTGARLLTAGLNRVIWSNTICPDGANSNANGGTCLGHL
jgi:Pentapeptide repeats (9 copies)